MPAPEIRRGLQCSAERHLWRSGLALAVYMKILALTWTKEGPGETEGHYGTYHTSIDKMSGFLGCHYQAAYSAFKLLVKEGWLERVDEGKNPYKSKNYRPVSHRQWAERHPGQCLVGETFTWDGEVHDKLAQALWKASFGKTRWYAHMLTALRSTGMDDREILVAWDNFLEKLTPKPQRKKEWEHVRFRFISELKGRRAVVQSTD